jgi:hypothetical protein
MDKDDVGFIMILVVVALASLIGGAYIAGTDMQKEAVKRGHAAWVADGNGEAKFTWKEIGDK